MDQFSYQRPREKLYEKGVAFLTLAELVQAILGSGSAGASAAKLARRLERLMLPSQKPAYNDLVAIGGIGHAKACQLLAAIELGRRLQQVPPDDHLSFDLLLDEARRHKKASLVCNWYDGARELLGCRVYKARKAEHYSLLVRNAFADGLTLGARSAVVALPTENVATPTARALGMVQALLGAASLLDLQLKGIYGVSTTQHSDWGREA